MSRTKFATLLRTLIISCALLPSAVAAWGQTVPAAQNAPHGYDFLTVTVLELTGKSMAKVLITPAFQGKTEIQLADMSSISVTKNVELSQQNASIVNQQLSDLTVAGWELAAVFNSSISGYATPRYLFRRPRP